MSAVADTRLLASRDESELWRLSLIHVVFFRSSVEIHVHCVSDFLFRLQVQCVSDLLLGYSFVFGLLFRISVQCVSDLLS